MKKRVLYLLLLNRETLKVVSFCGFRNDNLLPLEACVGEGLDA